MAKEIKINIKSPEGLFFIAIKNKGISMSPYKPRPGCKYPLCSNKAEKGSSYCKIHKKIVEKQRLTPAERGYDYKWQKFRKEYLKKNPFCVECLNEGRITPALVVDHIEPHRGDQDKFWDSNNLQSLCESCHNRKTAKGK